MKRNENTTCVIELRGVSKVFDADRNKTVAVRNISFAASLGELVLLLGPSGSGKTTVLTLVAGLVKPTTGCVSLFGNYVQKYSPQKLQQLRAEHIGFVFQTFHLIDSLNVKENVALVCRFAGKNNQESRAQAQRSLHQLHIEHLAEKFPPTLSQGEKQRVAISRAVANDAELILADEPTASLETNQGFQIIHLLHQYAKEEHKCVIVASHDLRIEAFADRVLRLEDGAIVETTPSHSIFTAVGKLPHK